MTVNRGLWVPINAGNIGTTEVEARLADVGLFESNNGTDARSGVLNSGGPTLVSGTTGMTYSVAPATFVVGRTVGEGAYRFSATGTTTVATTAAPVSGSRIDSIWVRQNDQVKGDANNLAVIGVTQGAASGTPVAPSVPAGALELAQATVAPGVTATNTASIAQTFRMAALRGNPVPVRTTAERDEITAPRVGQAVARLDLDPAGMILDVWTGAAWVGFGESSADLLAVAGWTSRGSVIKTRAGGRIQVTAALEITRTGAAIAVGVGDTPLLVNAIPTGFMPSQNHYAIAAVNTNIGDRYAEPQIAVNNGGSLVGRSTSGGGITIGTGFKMYLATNWII